MFDRRLNAFRPDLADKNLYGKVKAKHFVSGIPNQVKVGSSELREKPDLRVCIDTELLFGEAVDVFEIANEWAWVKAHKDGYVGYMNACHLTPHSNKATHAVSVLRTYIYPEPDLKFPPLHLISMNAELSLSYEESNSFKKLSNGAGWIFQHHVTPINQYAYDHCEIAMQFTGTPYRWGGRTSLGIDCSGLVQMALMRCGIDAPRDSDLQETWVGREVIFDDDFSDLKMGDIVYWTGHCGIWIDKFRFIHANAKDMMVSIQPLSKIIKSISLATGDAHPRVRRPT